MCVAWFAGGGGAMLAALLSPNEAPATLVGDVAELLTSTWISEPG
jgi:hypothetical protein